VAWKDKVYVAGDDGWLYCLSAADGSLRWRFRAGPDDRKIIGNGHLVSMWPARGGPVLADGTIYLGASIWPFMGSFICAVDAETGRGVWVNSSAGVDFRPAYSYQGSGGFVRHGLYGSVPQGYFTVVGDRLAVPQGRNIPQIFDRRTGRLLFHEIFGMHPGDSTDHWYALTAGGRVFSGRPGVGWARGGIAAIDAENLRLADRNPCGNGVTGGETLYLVSLNGAALTGMSAAPPFRALWTLRLSPAARPTCAGSYIKAGDNLYLHGAGGELLIVKDVDTDKRQVVAGPKVPGGAVWDMLAADGKLFVVTIDGKIACYGGGKVEPKTHAHEQRALEVPKDLATIQAREILKATGQTDGYCLVLFPKGSVFAEVLLAESNLNIIAVDADEKKIAELRRRMDDKGVYGARFSAHVGDPLRYGLPPYLANLIVSEDPAASRLLGDPSAAKELFRALRPYGGTICLPAGRVDEKTLAAADLDGAVVRRVGDLVLVERKGGPPGSADWTHSNSDAANTMFSPDKLVKPPLGVLWFGGPPNTGMLPRHGHGPSPQVVNGRLFVEGRHLLRAVDVYTGRLLWERTFADLGRFYDSGGKQLGAHGIGSNYASAADAVYVITPQKCVALDAATGKTLSQFELPSGVEKDSIWGSIRVLDDLLIATIRPIDAQGNAGPGIIYGTSSQVLAVYDRKSGKPVWVRKAKSSFGHNAVIAAAGKVFCVDKFSGGEVDFLKRRGIEVTGKACMYAIKARTGEVIWQTEENLFGTWLGYSQEHDVLVQGGSGRFGSEVSGLVALKGADGSLLWKSPPPQQAGGEYNLVGPPMLHHDTVISQFGRVLGILDGKPRTQVDRLTGKAVPWTTTPHACGVTNASEHLILLRAGGGHAGFFEIRDGFILHGMGGFRSSCTANMIAAGGVLNAPEYTRTCMCQFKNQTSIALVHMPEEEFWGFDFGAAPVVGRIARLGLNFGAPGDRVSEEGTLWLDWPSVGGPSRQVNVTLEPAKEGTQRDWRGTVRKAGVFAGTVFRNHSSAVESGPMKWVTASGLSAVRAVRVELAAGGQDVQPTANYTVRLYFAEPDAAAGPGSRVFSVSLQGRGVLKDFDVLKAAGGPRRGIVKEFAGIQAADKLELQFTPVTGEPLICGLEVIMQK
jgi:outer membrane protein assembly factor BamB